MSNYVIRPETPADYRTVENVHREAFWNVNFPGCDEHYLAHVLRESPDFIPELSLVCEVDGDVVGSVMYSKSTLTDAEGKVTATLTFGPIGVLPAWQRKGISKALLERSFEIAKKMGYPAIVIFGDPANYVARGFKSCMKFNVSVGDGIFPTAMLVKELTPGFFDGRAYSFCESSAFDGITEADTAAFDALFPPKEKGWSPVQESFFILSHSKQTK